MIVAEGGRIVKEISESRDKGDPAYALQAILFRFSLVYFTILFPAPINCAVSPDN